MGCVTSPRKSRKRQSEQGFALLLVFLMAAAVALMLYQQVPRVAFESERDKEQLLIDRGEQYRRAIQLYYLTYKKYPARIEDLENTNDKRFLRRRYVDPYTGKDDWRLIHTNGAFLTDSKVQKPPAAPAQSNGQGGLSNSQLASTTNPAANGITAANGTDPNAPKQVNAAVLQRPSDRTLVPPRGTFPGASGLPGQGVNSNPNPNDNYNDPSKFPPITLFPNGYPGQNGQPAAGQQAGQQPGVGVGQPGFVQPGFVQSGVIQPGAIQPNGIQNGTLPGGIQPGIPRPVPGQQLPGQPVNNGVLPGGVLPGGYTPGVPGQFPPGLNPNFANQLPSGQNPVPNQYRVDANGQLVPINPADGVPGQIQPNSPDPNQPQTQYPAATNGGGFPNGTGFQQNGFQPGGPGGAGPAGTANQAVNLINTLLTTPRQPPPGLATGASQPLGAGIAGVASSFTGPTIKVYNKQDEFDKWEFVFQPQQVLPGVPGGQNPNGQNSNGQNPGSANTGIQNSNGPGLLNPIQPNPGSSPASPILPGGSPPQQ